MGLAETNSIRMSSGAAAPPAPWRDPRGGDRARRLGEPPGRQGEVEEAGTGDLHAIEPLPGLLPGAQALGHGVGDLARRAASRPGQGHRHRARDVAHLGLRRRRQRHGGGLGPQRLRGLPRQRVPDAGEKGGVGHEGTAYRPAGALRAAAVALASVALALPLAACGGEERAASGTAPGGGETRLVVRHLDGERQVRTTDLGCASGDPRCARVVALLPVLRPDPDEVCTQIYGGPERMIVEGVVGGEPVRAEVTRRNGCEIARYDRLEAALRG